MIREFSYVKKRFSFKGIYLTAMNGMLWSYGSVMIFYGKGASFVAPSL